MYLIHLNQMILSVHYHISFSQHLDDEVLCFFPKLCFLSGTKDKRKVLEERFDSVKDLIIWRYKRTYKIIQMSFVLLDKALLTPL